MFIELRQTSPNFAEFKSPREATPPGFTFKEPLFSWIALECRLRPRRKLEYCAKSCKQITTAREGIQFERKRDLKFEVRRSQSRLLELGDQIRRRIVYGRVDKLLWTTTPNEYPSGIKYFAAKYPG